MGTDRAVSLPSNDWAFEQTSRVEIINVGPNLKGGFIGIDIINGQHAADQSGERVIINVDRDEFVKQVQALLDQIKENA
jgi:hypothetical protein